MIEIEQIEIPLKKLYLDPENFRIIDKIKEAEIKLETGLTEVSQNIIMNILLGGAKAEEIKDLIQSFQTNGFLNINQIYAKKISDDKYIVMEGNRRIATLKYIYQLYKLKQFDLKNLSEDIFEKVPITIYSTEETKKHLIIAGLDHIKGKVSWPSKNQAEYLYTLINVHGYTQTEISRILGGLSIKEIRRSLKTFALMQQYKKNDIGLDEREITYTVFRTIVSKPAIRNWLELEFVESEDCKITYIDPVKMERIFSWISPSACAEKGYKKTIINSETDVAQLSKIINDENALDILEDTGDLNWAVSSSGIQARENAKANLRKAYSFIKSVDEFSTFLEKDDVLIASEIEKSARRINHANANSSSINTEDKNKTILNLIPSAHFSEINFEKFKVLNNVKLVDPKRINIIAGKNNNGKTTILEAIYLLCNLNDPFSYLNLLKNRGRFYNFPDSSWINEYSKNLKINGFYNQQNVSLIIENSEEKNKDLDKTRYISTIKLKADVHQREFTSQIQLFKPRETNITFDRSFGLCNFAYTNPFVFSVEEESFKHFSKSLAFLNEIVEFINQNVDSKVTNIIYDPDSKRFYVVYNKQRRDLTMLGSGLQYIFLSIILFAYARDGVVLIDEVENGIHFGLMTKYTLLLHKLAERFNVQLFITSHSDECINSFINNNYKTNDIVGYHTYSDDSNNLQIKRIAGLDFKEYLVDFGFDLRGERK